jgi:predicted Zn-dependent protease
MALGFNFPGAGHNCYNRRVSTTIAGTELGAAIAQYEAGHHAEAAAAFAALRSAAPDDPTLLRLTGLALTRAGRTEEALPLLARARRLDFAQPLAHLHYGIALLQAGQAARAAAAFRRATMLAPDDPAGWINFSAALVALDQPRAGRAAARRAVALGRTDADALYALGQAEAACGDTAGARAAFLEAARARRAFADAWLNYGVASYRLGDIAACVQAMRRAVTEAPGYGPAEANLAAFELLRGDTDTALARLHGVLARDPGCIPARLNLANAMLLDGHAEAALEVLQEAAPAGRDGAHWRAHRALALLLLDRAEAARAELDAIVTPGDAEILILWRRIHLAERDGDAAAAATMAARMGELADDPHAALLEHRIIGHFELARWHDNGDRIDIAFGHWDRGHKLLSQLQPFSRKALAEFIDATVAAYDQKRLHQGARAANRDGTPIFIVGMPRSGTTLAEQILAAHPMVHGGGERNAVHALISRLAPQVGTAESVAALALLDSAILTGEAEAFLADLHALAPAALRIVDKMPVNARHLGFIATLLPGARVIHCVRDPADIGLSIYQHRFFGHHPYAHDLGDLGWTIGQHGRLMAHWRATLPLPVLEVRLQDWVDDFRATLERVLAFVDLPYDTACEQFHRQDRLVRTASAAQVRQPVNARGIGRWRRYAAWLTPLLDELERGTGAGGQVIV